MKFSELINKFTDEKNKETPLNWHEDFIVHIAKILRPKVYLELGTYQCVLFNRLIPYANKLIGIDRSREAGKFMKKTKKTHFYCLTTDEYYKKLREKPIKIDLLFIDANHSKETVLKDFRHFFPFVSDQGMVLLHDSYPKNKAQTNDGFCGDGFLTIKKLSKTVQDYEMMTIPVPPGLTLCRKRKKHLGWGKE